MSTPVLFRHKKAQERESDEETDDPESADIVSTLKKSLVGSASAHSLYENQSTQLC